MTRQGALPREGLEGRVLQEVLESLPLPVHYTDLHGAVAGCNRALEQFLGRPRREIIGRRITELFPAEEAQVLALKDEGLLRSGGRQVFRLDHQGPAGPRHLLAGKALWIDAQGGVAGVVTQLQDITEFRDLEAEHLESEGRMRALLEGLQEREAQFRALFVAGNGIKLLLAPEGGWILDANPAAEAYLGYDLGTLRTLSFRDLGPDEAEGDMRGVVESGSGRFVRRLRTAAGEERNVEVYAAPVEIKGRTYIWATLHDITDGVQAEAALRLSEDRLRSLAESIQAVIFRFERDGACTYVNGHYERLTGLPPGPVLARKWTKVIHPQDRERILDGWRTARKLGQVHETEFRLLDARGEEVWVLGRTTPERGPDGAITGFLTTCTDITRLRRAEEALRLAAKHESLGLMAGAIANDFNNILQAVWSSLDLLESGAGDAGQRAQALAWARGSLSRGKRITRFIEEYSGQGVGNPVSLDLGRHLQAFVADQGVPGGQVRLAFEAEPGLPRVLIDPDQLTHCLKAMVANALEALGPGPGSVRLQARKPAPCADRDGVWILRPQPGPCVELAVENDGPAIPREELPRIFDPYYTTKEAGRGLGLSSVLGILRAHGAGLHVESLPGTGVRIRVVLAVGGRVSSDLADLPAGPGAILVVDDQPEVLLVISHLLQGFLDRPILTASSGEEALAIARERGGDLGAVLMDANMPGMDGTAAFQAMQALVPGLPGILISGCDREQGLALARTYGFSGFVKKPFESEALREVFAALL